MTTKRVRPVKSADKKVFDRCWIKIQIGLAQHEIMQKFLIYRN